MNICKLRMVKEEVPEYEGLKTKVSCAGDVVKLAKDVLHLHEEPEEVFYVLGLNTRHEITDIWEVSRGSLRETVVHPREVYKRLLLGNCQACLFLHNHPSGDENPSTEDTKLTIRLRDAGKVLGVAVLDHMIVGDNEGYSYAARQPNIIDGRI